MTANEETPRGSAAGRWMSQARELLDRIAETQMETISIVAGWCADTISGGGLVHLFGSGHSRIPLEEMFPRYGSFPGFHPIAELSMTFHTEVVGTNGQRQAMFIERVGGLAEVILSNYQFGDNDLMMVFSSSGRSAVPVEMAMGASERGLKVIAITSVAESMASEATHPSGTRLLDHADAVIDIGTPPGDALVQLDGLDSPVGPGSTVANVAVVNEIKVQVADLLLARGITPTVLTSGSLVGEEKSRALFDDAYGDYAHRLAQVLDRGTGS
jgi:uncharacterized phosphosugar-binding protein